MILVPEKWSSCRRSLRDWSCYPNPGKYCDGWPHAALPMPITVALWHSAEAASCLSHSAVLWLWGQQFPKWRGGSVTEAHIQLNGPFDLHPYNERRNRLSISTVLSKHQLVNGGDSQRNSALSRDCWRMQSISHCSYAFTKGGFIKNRPVTSHVAWASPSNISSCGCWSLLLCVIQETIEKPQLEFLVDILA